MSSIGKTVKVSGPLIIAEGMADAKMYDVVRVSKLGLIGEIIEMRGDRASVQVYEETSGFGPGEEVVSTGEPLSAELGPGLLTGIFDGIQRPLTTLFFKSGNRISRGVSVNSLDRERKWHFVPCVRAGDVVEEGDVLGTVQETEIVSHRILVPNGMHGKVTSVAEGDFTVTDTVATLRNETGEEKVCMLECGANEVDNDTMMEAIIKGHQEVQKMCRFIAEVQAEIGKPKFSFESKELDHDMFEAVKEYAIDRVKYALDTDDKNIREERLRPVYEEVHAHFDPIYPEQEMQIDECLYKLQKFVVRRWLLDEGKRVDGRGMDEMRPLAAEVGLIPRVHGSGMFTRGQTQVLTIATLGSIRDLQLLDGIDEETEKRYIHHYNFPSYSVGETRPSRGPGRREIGHGALAEKALRPVIPSVEEFPYTLRLVSEVLSSNGSTSQASICGSTLALMDAGVPIKAPVAGISCGLISEGDGWSTMVDIQGLEDFFGDMDFKVGGTHKGITAIQVDMKVHGISYDVIRSALDKTYKARCYILDEIMLKAIPEVRPELSKYAPKMLTLMIDTEKIREVIGSGGKVIQKISADCGVKIDIEDDGHVFVSGVDMEGCRRAVQIIETIAKDPEVGAFYKGRVTRLMNFGAFVEIAPGKEGLVHISKLDTKRVERVEDVVSVGDEIIVKVTEIDSQGRINLSRRDALEAMEAKKK